MSPSSTPCSWLLVPAITGAPLVSSPFGVVLWSDAAAGSASVGPAAGAATGEGAIVVAGVDAPGERSAPPAAPDPRSEEHTSELQSRENLVCRRLLEKK